MRLDGAVAVVTGASAGIGWATAAALARQRSVVVAAARREDRLRELVEAIEARGGRASAVACDVRDLAQIERLVARVRADHGRCDVLVNNAGIPGGGRFAELSWEQVEAVIRTNLLGVVACTKAFLPTMLEAGRGHVVNVASLAGRFAVPGAAVYTSAKHAVVAFSEALHFELAPLGIRVTTVNPGLVATEGFPQREMLARRPWLVMRPEQVADVIVDVVRTGKAPEVSIPRTVAALQAFRLLTPPLYRWAMRRLVRSGPPPTGASER